MKKMVILAVVIILATATCAFAQVMKQVDVETLKQMKIKLERLHAIETARPDFKLIGVEVVQGADGKILVKETAKAEVAILPDLKYAGDVKVNADVKVYPTIAKEKSPIVSHFGLLYGLTSDIKNRGKLDAGQLHLTFTPLTYKRFSVELPFNTKNWGAGFGWRVVSHTKLVFGGLVKWGDVVNKDTVLPYVGVGLNF